jgi:hypothetical protein
VCARWPPAASIRKAKPAALTPHGKALAGPGAQIRKWLPAMRLNDRMGDRQAHPYSVRLRGVESLENAIEMVRINARP